MQYQADPKNISKIIYKNDFDCFIKILKYEGLKGITKGMVSTMARSVPMYIGLFAGYELSKAYFIKNHPKNEFTPVATAISGALSGVLCWTLAYP